MINAVSNAYRLNNKKRVMLITLGLILLFLSFVSDIYTGPGGLSWSQIFSAVFEPETSAGNIRLIVWDIRLPIAITAILIGAMLAAAGAQMQTLLNNPLADPFTLGISSAASFGAALPLVFNVNILGISDGVDSSVSAFVFAILTTALLYVFTRIKESSAEVMVLVGIALLFAFNALLSIVQYAATDAQLSQIVFWMMGSLGRSSWYSVSVCGAVLLPIMLLFMVRAWPMTSLRMGEEKARSLGVNVKRLRIEILVGVSLLTATAVSFVGTVGFVGLVGPHIARMLVGEDQRFFLPLSIIAGALLMSLTSVVSKAATPGVIYPIGMITSLIGIPFFISLILKTQRRSWS
ncbi:FecCD family ABC transporter permease [Arenicella xantha]|uniref:Iron complex transport system permease protein n=1 Tax=Arenicella xantha TaxID=644221 RepID=A0A395JM87_9GAMM|nr:iron ABC transporter permease [Arenicella xantha]RBP50724.1 iron complex transport system permease protein [Arenicella xantha]